MAGKPNPLVQQALGMLKADPGLSVYEAAKRTGANQQSLYAAVRRLKLVADKLEPAPPPVVILNAAIKVIEAELRTCSPARKAAILSSLEVLVRLAKVGAVEPEEPEAELSFARVIGPSRLPDIE